MLLLITAAGAGSRFQREGMAIPKPLIQVQGRSLLEHTLASFGLEPGDQLLIAVQRAHRIPAHLNERLCAALPQVALHWVELDGLLPGQLATAVQALEQALPKLAPAETPDPALLIHNCDTGFAWHESLRPPTDTYGAMAVFPAEGEHWSFGQPDPSNPGRAIAIAEKRRISDLASIGLYGFGSTARFLADAKRQLAGTGASNATVNGEHYVAPLLNSAISAGETVLLPRVEGVQLYGTPAELCSTFGLTWAELLTSNPSES
ncbi:NTP transferase domain-containing protein [Cyanobium sp. ATX 6E8]|uniref:NTP transferase domain-containing protein n=1 Tax=Cyanobium sp. ATX 6E8 TaxID=2823701 RepID=UPI0020CCE000|nr:NTP transferase domain-containing protein [Cyanobium sp. ATX 6E8]MCP9942753.1 NTP transferase domain-containing protein [Cyanobium sp. ATX 6E8]